MCFICFCLFFLCICCLSTKKKLNWCKAVQKCTSFKRLTCLSLSLSYSLLIQSKAGKRFIALSIQLPTVAFCRQVPSLLANSLSLFGSFFVWQKTKKERERERSKPVLKICLFKSKAPAHKLIRTKFQVLTSDRIELN